MNFLRRSSSLVGAILLLVVGIYCLKQQDRESRRDLAFVPPSEIAIPSTNTAPTLLQSTSSHEVDSVAVQGELSPVPPDSLALTDIDHNESKAVADNANGLPLSSSNHASLLPTEAPRVSVSTAVLLAPMEASPSTGEETPLPIPEFAETQQEDSLWTISERIYGCGDYYKALFLHNRASLPRPDRIPAGVRLSTPPAEELRRLYPEASPQTQHQLPGERRT